MLILGLSIGISVGILLMNIIILKDEGGKEVLKKYNEELKKENSEKQIFIESITKTMRTKGTIIEKYDKILQIIENY